MGTNSNVDLIDAYLPGVHLSNAILWEANLNCANPTEAVLKAHCACLLGCANEPRPKLRGGVKDVSAEVPPCRE
jgi:hypothetical protein